MTYNKVNPKQSFPELEIETLKYWKENKTFEKSIENRSESPEFAFYDGPPFATGTPHYGHILAGTLKDVVPRYQTMNGYRVDRVFGWDCHGLPIENIVEKKLNISGKTDIEEKVGVYEFNEACRSNVFVYTEEWKKTVERMGRWVDMENSYKTMDKEFMESVWWVFKSIYDKGLIYEGNRVVPYCPRCTTPLSNFEVNQGYKDKQDKTLTVKFKVKGNDKKYILAWTTTPWTLRANLGLAVGADIMYSEILDKKSGETYVLATDRLKSYYKTEEDYQIIREYKGACLEGIKYEPIFDDFDLQLNEMGANLGTNVKLGKNAYSVVIGHHVTTESGTGIVHIAPAYGEDDNIIGEASDLGFVIHINDNGRTYNLLEHNDTWVFDFNEQEIQRLKDAGKIVAISTIDHSYPHCRRCDTPLVYRAIPAWYVAVEKFKDKMVENNKKINWVPGTIKEGRFGKWLENARDWNISRNRYWGSAIPVWQNEAKTEEICVGSIEELYELNKDFGQIERRPVEKSPLLSGEGSGVRTVPGEGFGGGGYKYFYTETNQEIDLHKHFVDKILVKNPATGNTLKRVTEVLDCWFESGSMPYASKHYPFENNSPHLASPEGEGQNKSPSPSGEGARGGGLKFPADFIAEGLDQTRGWFYTLLILGTALFDETPFLNVIVNGIILAEDGQKMSKSKKNYPDPKIIFQKYGADAMRFYLMNSPVVEAQDLRFSEAGVEEVVKKLLLPLWNTYYFFTTYANIDGFVAKSKGQTQGTAPTENAYVHPSNPLDKWIISELNKLIKDVKAGFDKYTLQESTRPILQFMDNLTNWYIRRSRKRFWKSENDGDKIEAYNTLYEVLVELTKIIAPFTPFIAENIYRNLTGNESVHLENYPVSNKDFIKEDLNKEMELTQKIVNLGLAFRANRKLRVRQPLSSITIGEKLDDYYLEIIKEELNVKEVIVLEDSSKIARKIAKPNAKLLGPKYGKEVQTIISEAKAGNFIELENGDILIPHPSSLEQPHPSPLLRGEGTDGFLVKKDEYEIAYEKSDDSLDIEAGFGMVIAMDSVITEDLKLEGFARDIVRQIQEARKEAGFEVSDRIEISLTSSETVLDDVISKFSKYIETETLSSIVTKLENTNLEKDIEIDDIKFNLKLKK